MVMKKTNDFMAVLLTILEIIERLFTENISEEEQQKLKQRLREISIIAFVGYGDNPVFSENKTVQTKIDELAPIISSLNLYKETGEEKHLKFIFTHEDEFEETIKKILTFN
jgi:hypothetical protein